MSNEGNVSLVGPTYTFQTGGSFQVPLTDPGTSPADEPQVCVHINVGWQPLLAGAALQLCMPRSWTAADDSALADLLDRAVLAFNAVGEADRCPAADVVAVTILAGSGSGSAAVTFTATFPSAPVVVVSCDTPGLMASAVSVTDSGFTAVLTSDVELLADVTANVSYIAMLAA